ncbi:transposase, partial [Pseudomonas syringae pv. syringae]
MSNSSDFSAWIGRRQESQDRISFTLVRRIAATLGESAPKPGEPLPPLWHWAFFQEPVGASELGHGRTGSLLFVTVRHEFFQDGKRALQDDQDIVYREASPPKLNGTETLPEGQWQERIEPTPTLLFRYSAVTFNGHRIHYDWPYVTETEGYPGLVVHGPLIATLNLRAFTKAHPAARLERFAFRG